MDEDWHAICQAIFQGRDQNGRPCLTNTPMKTKKAKVLRALKEARDKGIDCYDAGREKKIQTRSQVRLDFVGIHLKSPTAALAKALEGLEQGDRVPSATSDW